MCNQEIAKEDNNTTEICILSQEELKACPTKDLLKMMLKLSRICRKEEKEYGHLLKSGICAAAELYIIKNILENFIVKIVAKNNKWHFLGNIVKYIIFFSYD